MTVQKVFEYSDKAHYPHAGVFNKKLISIIKQSIVISSDGKSFNVDFPNIFEKYILPHVTSNDIVQRWNTD